MPVALLCFLLLLLLFLLFFFFYFEFWISIFATIPFIPLSVTNILLPFPIIVIGVWVSFANLHISSSSSSFFIVINASAFPPYFKCCVLFHWFIVFYLFFFYVKVCFFYFCSNSNLTPFLSYAIIFILIF